MQKRKPSLFEKRTQKEIRKLKECGLIRKENFPKEKLTALIALLEEFYGELWRVQLKAHPIQSRTSYLTPIINEIIKTSEVLDLVFLITSEETEFPSHDVGSILEQL